jgi:CTP:molybdopterin cytidylyltransferase MocA
MSGQEAVKILNQNKKIAGLILAAGFSSRMGKIKPLLPIGSVTLLERVISSFFAGGINDIFLVLGHYQNQILSNLPYKDQINIIYNPLYPQGMLSSIRAGINAISDTAGAF